MYVSNSSYLWRTVRAPANSAFHGGPRHDGDWRHAAEAHGHLSNRRRRVIEHDTEGAVDDSDVVIASVSLLVGVEILPLQARKPPKYRDITLEQLVFKAIQARCPYEPV